MRSRGFQGRVVFWSAVHGAIRVSDWARKAGAVALLSVVMLAAAAAWMTTSTSAHVWVWKGWVRLFGEVKVAQGRPASNIESQTSSGSNTSGVASFDVPAAGTGEAEGTIAFGVNASGEITGAYSNSLGVVHGYVFGANGTFTTFDAPNAGTTSPGIEGTIPISIDTAGDVAGTYIDANLVYHGFVRTASGTLTQFDDPNASTAANRGTAAISMNDAGQIVGFFVTGSYDTTSTYHGFLRAADGTMTSIDAPGAGTGESSNGRKQGTMVFGINASGEMVGSYIDSSNARHGFVRSAGGTFTEFDPPGSTTTTVSGGGLSGTQATSIDTAGDVAGSYTDANFVRHGFLRTADGTITSFDAPGVDLTAPSGELGGTFAINIDPSGSYIAGGYDDANGLAHGFVRASDGTITTFDAPNATTIAPMGASLPLFGTSGFSVNALGEVAGEYIDSNEVLHGLVYTQNPPAITSPAPGSTLASGNVTFTWNPNGATGIELKLGTLGPGATDLYNGAVTTATSVTVSIPANGVTVFATLVYHLNGVWDSVAYTYTESGSPTLPSMISPTPSSTLSGSTTFTWNPGAGVTGIELKLGTLDPGASDLYNGAITTATSVTVSIPANGVTVFATLVYHLNGVEYLIPYTYTESGSPTPPSMISPTPGSTLSGSTTFTWSPGSGVTGIELKLGTDGPGASDLYNGAITTATSVTVNIPANGVTVFATLVYHLNSVEHEIPYTYTESGSPTLPAMISPTPGSELNNPNIFGPQTFTWSPGAGPTLFELKLGTSPLANNIYNGAATTATSVTVNLPLPNSPANFTVYATLVYHLNGTEYSILYTYLYPFTE